MEDLQRRQDADSNLATRGYLPERELKFSEADEGQIAACIGFGGFAFLATLFLGSLILAQAYPIMGLVVPGFPFLLAYTAAFLGIPLYRYLNLETANEEITARNTWRSQQADVLKQLDRDLKGKIADAANWAKKQKTFGEAIYDSSQSSEARVAKTEASDMADFDKRLGKK